MVTANAIALTIFFIVPTSVVVSFPLQTSSVIGVIPALGDFKEIGGRARRPGNCAGSPTVSTRSRDLVGRWGAATTCGLLEDASFASSNDLWRSIRREAEMDDCPNGAPTSS